MRQYPVDKPFLAIVVTLIVVGFFIFLSASMGLHARGGISFGSIVLKQVGIGIVFGSLVMYAVSRIPYRLLRQYSFYILGAGIVATLLVFIPGLGIEKNGATRWISVFGLSMQPAELLKIATVIYVAAWLSAARTRLHEFRFGLLPIMVMLGVVGIILAMQPDMGTMLVITSAAFAMYVAAGANWRDIGLFILIMLMAAVSLVAVKPYILERMKTFINPASDAQGAGYQVRQSLIAIGSGEWVGRGFGQSIQKFSYLPEPIGDSVFAVAAEEFGFAGSLVLIFIFLAFLVRGLKIAARAPDMFGGLLVLGIVILIVVQSFVNIASMLGIFPLTGMPLIFVSHGGTALLVSLASIGIILNVSRIKPEL